MPALINKMRLIDYKKLKYHFFLTGVMKLLSIRLLYSPGLGDINFEIVVYSRDNPILIVFVKKLSLKLRAGKRLLVWRNV